MEQVRARRAPQPFATEIFPELPHNFLANVAALYHYYDASSKAILAELEQCYILDCTEYNKIGPFDSSAKPLQQKDALQATCHLRGNLNWLTVITESQNVRGWKGPLWVIYSKLYCFSYDLT